MSKKKYKAKKSYFQELLAEAKNSDDRKATWDIINMAFGKKKKKRVYPEQIQNGDPSNPTVIKCPKEIADVFNTYFTNVAKNLAENLQETSYKHTDFMGKENKSSMYLKFIELHEILDEIKIICIQKVWGYDEIVPKIVKWALALLPLFC